MSVVTGAQIAGLSMGGIGLAAELLKTFVQVWGIYRRGQSIPEEYTCLVIRIRYERMQFLAFCQAAGLDSNVPQLSEDLKKHKDFIAEIFEEMGKIFAKTKEHHRKYSRHLSERLNNVSDTDVELKLIDNLGAHTILALEHQVAEPRPIESSLEAEPRSQTEPSIREANSTSRWTWAIADAEHLEKLVSQLTQYNQVLKGILEHNTRIRQLEAIDAMSRGQIQLNSSEQVVQMYRAVQSLPIPSQQPQPSVPVNTPLATVEADDDPETEQRQTIEGMLQIRIRYQENLTGAGVIRAMTEVQPISKSLLKNFTRPIPKRSFATLAGDHVWIDWKDPEAIGPDDEVHKNRIKLLVHLLCSDTIKVFRSPVCLGYISHKTEEQETEYGLVFRLPHRDTKLISLRQLISHILVPSVHERATLSATIAESIYNFHTIGWMHKGIRSENIVFMKEKDSPVDYSKPFLVGFDLSRPESIQDLTMKPPRRSKLEELYRHPNAQYTLNDQAFRKSYDIYSLALILIEIATWRSIEDFLNISDVEGLDVEQLTMYKEKLINEDHYRQTIGNEFRNSFADVVYDCLIADRIDKPTVNGVSEAVVALEIQNMENLKIVKPLRTLSSVS